MVLRPLIEMLVVFCELPLDFPVVKLSPLVMLLRLANRLVSDCWFRSLAPRLTTDPE